jgi:MerC mercury resistance protein
MPLSRYFDRIAIALSTVCIVHCLALPLALVIVPVAALVVDGDGHFHQLMLWLVVPTSVLGFGLGYRVHGHGGLVALGALAVAILALVAFYGHGLWSTAVEVLVSVAASALLASAHWRNFREVRRLHSHA